jgi:hypothetical protein
MTAEGHFEKSSFNWNLSVALSSWQKWPDGREAMEKMQEMINKATKDTPIVLSVKGEVLRNLNLSDSFITPGVVMAYGEENGSLIEFSTSKVRMKVSESEHKGYLFLEKDGQRLAYFRPQLIANMSIKQNFRSN